MEQIKKTIILTLIMGRIFKNCLLIKNKITTLTLELLKRKFLLLIAELNSLRKRKHISTNIKRKYKEITICFPKRLRMNIKKLNSFYNNNIREN